MTYYRCFDFPPGRKGVGIVTTEVQHEIDMNISSGTRSCLAGFRHTILMLSAIVPSRLGSQTRSHAGVGIKAPYGERSVADKRLPLGVPTRSLRRAMHHSMHIGKEATFSATRVTR